MELVTTVQPNGGIIEFVDLDADALRFRFLSGSVDAVMLPLRRIRSFMLALKFCCLKASSLARTAGPIHRRAAAQQTRRATRHRRSGS
jgi:hypothetical protein